MADRNLCETWRKPKRHLGPHYLVRTSANRLPHMALTFSRDKVGKHEPSVAGSNANRSSKLLLPVAHGLATQLLPLQRVEHHTLVTFIFLELNSCSSRTFPKVWPSLWAPWRPHPPNPADVRTGNTRTENEDRCRYGLPSPLEAQTIWTWSSPTALESFLVLEVLEPYRTEECL